MDDTIKLREWISTLRLEERYKMKEILLELNELRVSNQQLFEKIVKDIENLGKNF